MQANTSVCTKEVCAFRDAYTKFEEHGAAVIGLSSDAPDKLSSFAQVSLSHPCSNAASCSSEGHIERLAAILSSTGACAWELDYLHPTLHGCPRVTLLLVHGRALR